MPFINNRCLESYDLTLDSQCDLARDAVVEQGAMLEIITTDKSYDTLRGQVCTDSARDIDYDGRANNFHLDRIDIRLRAGVRSRRHLHHINNRQSELLGQCFINAGGGRSCVN